MIDLADLLPPGAVVESARVGELDGPLFPEEAAAVAGAVARRRDEFRAGRLLARRALARLGGPQVALPVGPQRAPVWPAGFVGSIAHAAGIAVAAAAPTSLLGALGIDLEPADARWDPGMTDLVLTPDERAAADAPSPLAVFCAKEALYKALQPLAGIVFDFQDVTLRWSGGAVQATSPARPLRRGLASVEARCVVRGGWIMAACWRVQ